MFDVPIAFAVAAGMVAAVNPCGFALLPAYLAFFVGTEDGERSGPGRALFVTGALTAGFVTTFGAIGLALSTVATGIESHLPKVTVAIGAAMVVLGGLLLSGRSLSLPVPRLQRGGRTRDFGSMFLFGVSYATASLSCTIGPFLVALTPTFRDAGVLSGVSAFVAYSIGMGSVVGAVTVLVALAGAGAARRIRQWTPIVNRGAGALLVLAGAYVAYYGLWEIRGAAGDPIVDTAQEIRDRLATWIDGLSVWWPIAVLAVTGAGVLLRRQRSRTRARSGTVSPGRSDLDGERESA